MATIRAYTDLSQSKTLSKILPIESADMYYRLCDITKVWHPYLLIGYDNLQAREELFNLKQYKPCWSLAALLNVLPKGTNISTPKPINELGYCCWNQYDEIYADNPIDACVAMIEKLHELKML